MSYFQQGRRITQIEQCVRKKMQNTLTREFLPAIFNASNNSVVGPVLELNYRPKIFLFIGPHKTGSTSIQQYFFQNRKVFSEEWNYDLHDSLETSSNQINRFKNNCQFRTTIQNATMEGLNINETKNYLLLKQFLKKSLINQRNVILASECFSVVNHSPISFPMNTFKKIFQNLITSFEILFQHFDVKVIIVYRELISQFISRYKMHLRLNISVYRAHRSSSLSDLLLLQPFIDYEYLIQHYGRIFGMKNIILVDYYGSIQNGLDLRYIMTCKVIGIMCENQPNQPFTSKNSNTTIYEILKIFHLFASTHSFTSTGTGICDFDQMKMLHLANTINWPKIIPLITYDNTYYRQMSYDTDLRLRATFKGTLVYGNRTANIDAATRSKLTELDRYAILDNPEWINAMTTLLHVFINETMRCNQTNNRGIHLHHHNRPPGQ
eukprot:gene12819-27032_t